ncbi:MAG: FMN-dependent NADH-azoreductase [Betaproteobacteria bacterium]|nr:FMN-dependent NADH-azoreductase [Betaproteobacteria bacterium]
MNTILQINSSLHSAGGQSTRLADEFVSALRAKNPEAKLIVRDLAREPVPHLDADRFGAFVTGNEQRNQDQQAVVDYSDALIGELQRADVVVLGLPMYNFGVPSQLKAWIDHIARAGVTFRYTAKGPVGLLTGKKAYVFATRGGQYAGTPADSVTSYVRQLFAFLGITEVEFVYAENLAINEASKQKALLGAQNAIRRLMTQVRLAA